MENSQSLKSERKEVARFMRRLYRMGLTTVSGGNISLKIQPDIMLITVSGTDKGRLKWKDVGVMRLNGDNITPELKPSIEFAMHLAIYKRKNAVSAIVHAHPVFASSFTAMKNKIRTDLTAEAWTLLHEPLLAPYRVMGSIALAEQVAEKSLESNVLLLENHGVLTMGSSLLQAFDRMEVLENAARMTVITSLMGRKKRLSSKQKAEINKIFS